jgi:hypothetical protein
MDEQLSVTAWPGVVVPVPELTRWPAANLDGELIWLGPDHTDAVPPAEIYLRQARRISPVDVLDFVRSVGGVPMADRPSGGAEDLHDPDLDARQQFAAVRDRSYVAPDYVAGRGWVVHLDEVAYRLRVLDVLGRHAVAYRNGDYLAPIWTEARARLGGRPCKDEREAWTYFSLVANAALARFHPRLQVTSNNGNEILPLVATFLEAGTLQIVNDLVDEVDFINCPNCGQVFARQVGGSTHYSRSTGVTYCTPSCATAARVKAYRARKRAEGKQP